MHIAYNIIHGFSNVGWMTSSSMKSGLLGGIPQLWTSTTTTDEEATLFICCEFITLFAASKCKLRALGSISSTTVVAFSNVFNSATRFGII
jgi:hypothetical protein